MEMADVDNANTQNLGEVQYEPLSVRIGMATRSLTVSQISAL